MIIRKNVTIRAPAERIWDVITDLRRAKEWAPGFEDYPYISPEWPAAGASALWRYHAGLAHFDFRLTMTESVRGERLEIANTSAFGTGLEIYRFMRENEKTTIEYEARSSPNFLGKLFAKAMIRKLEEQMDTTVANLKKYCEAGS